MAQFIEEFKETERPSFGSRFAGAVGQMGEQAATEIPKLLQQKKADEQLSQFVGKDVSALPDAFKKVILEKTIAARQAEQLRQQKAQEQEVTRQDKFQEKEKEFEAKEKQEWGKENRAIFAESKKNLRSLETADVGLGQLERLSKKLGDTRGEGFFQKVGRSFRYDPETGGLTRIGKVSSNPEEERFIKLVADQTKTIKEDYGARITNLDMQIFLRRFPDLMMTSQGRSEILGTLRDYNEAKRLYNSTTKKVLKNTKGKISPYELDELVEEELGPKLEKIQQRIEKRGFSSEDAGAQEGAPETPAQEQVMRARNPATGEVIIFKDGRWQPETQ